MNKLDLIKEMIEAVHNIGYNAGVSEGHRIATSNQREMLKRRYREGQIFEANRLGDMDRVAELQKTEL